MLESIVRGAGSGPTIVLCHGFGASAEDLAPLADMLPVRHEIRWIFPQAPYAFQTLWGEGRAWFPRDRAAVEAFMSGSTLANLAEVDPPALAVAADEVLDLLQACECDAEATVVGGFSQGSMVALETALRMPRLPAGLLVLSGSIIAEERLRSTLASRAQEVRDWPVAQCHGREDQVLPFASGAQLAEVLRSAGTEVAFRAFSGGHGIPPELYPEIAAALEGMLGFR